MLNKSEQIIKTEVIKSMALLQEAIACLAKVIEIDPDKKKVAQKKNRIREELQKTINKHLQ